MVQISDENMVLFRGEFLTSRHSVHLLVDSQETSFLSSAIMDDYVMDVLRMLQQIFHTNSNGKLVLSEGIPVDKCWKQIKNACRCMSKLAGMMFNKFIFLKIFKNCG